jgi:hypothetical protein
MEDDHNILENGGPPQYFEKRKTTTIFWQMEDDLKTLANWRQHILFLNGRRPQWFCK